jgi:Flp pilus assembly protein TadB
MWTPLPELLDMTATGIESGNLLDRCIRIVIDDRELTWDF